MAAEPVSTVTEQQQQDDREFHWTDTAEPHSARRRAMLQKYGPQIRALYGNDPWTAYQASKGTASCQESLATGETEGYSDAQKRVDHWLGRGPDGLQTPS